MMIIDFTDTLRRSTDVK